MKFGGYLLIVILTLTCPAEAQVKERTFIHYTNAQGLPYSAISDILQDDEGFMWIATRMSVCRFDGYEFIEVKVYDHNGIQTYVRVPKLMKDSYGAVYLITYDSRLFK